MIGIAGIVDILDFETAGHLDLDDVLETTGTSTVAVVADGSLGILQLV
jgi:hypothetical protein